jgi:dienelactone hydrolase
MQITDNYKNAMIILHEIYGINQFIEEQCLEYHNKGFDVYCSDMLQRKYFDYSEAAEAYQFFMDNVGFDYFNKVNTMIAQLKRTYDKVFLMGFSVGATIAWRCCENDFCDGIICC